MDHQSINNSPNRTVFLLFLNFFLATSFFYTSSSCDYGSSRACLRPGKCGLLVISLLILPLTIPRDCFFHRWCPFSLCMYATWDLVILQKKNCLSIYNPRIAWQPVMVFPKNPLSFREILCEEEEKIPFCKHNKHKGFYWKTTTPTPNRFPFPTSSRPATVSSHHRWLPSSSRILPPLRSPSPHRIKPSAVEGEFRCLRQCVECPTRRRSRWSGGWSAAATTSLSWTWSTTSPASCKSYRDADEHAYWLSAWPFRSPRCAAPSCRSSAGRPPHRRLRLEGPRCRQLHQQPGLFQNFPQTKELPLWLIDRSIPSFFFAGIVQLASWQQAVDGRLRPWGEAFASPSCGIILENK